VAFTFLNAPGRGGAGWQAVTGDGVVEEVPLRATCVGAGATGRVATGADRARAGLSPTRVHQLTQGADLEALDAALP
jgi:hypothetical protein